MMVLGVNMLCVWRCFQVYSVHLQVNIAKAAIATSSESWNDTMHVTST